MLDGDVITRPTPAKQQKKAKKAPPPKIKGGVTRLGLEAKKMEDLPNWYSQVIRPYLDITYIIYAVF